MTIAEQLRQEGLEKGREEGRLQGARALLRRQIALRFGPLDAESARRVDAADADQLGRLTDRVLTAETLEALLIGL